MSFNINEVKSLFGDSEYIKPQENNIIYPSIFNINNTNSDISECYVLEVINHTPIQLLQNSISLDCSSIKINYKNMCKLTLKILKNLSTKLHFSGNSFSKVPLLLGDLTSYYTQYLANVIFEHPHATEPFSNLINLNNDITTAIDHILDTFYDKTNLETFLKKVHNVQSFNSFDKKLFKKGDILQFDIIINPPIFKNKLLENLKINTTLWKINMIIS